MSKENQRNNCAGSPLLDFIKSGGDITASGLAGHTLKMAKSQENRINTCIFAYDTRNGVIPE